MECGSHRVSSMFTELGFRSRGRQGRCTRPLSGETGAIRGMPGVMLVEELLSSFDFIDSTKLPCDQSEVLGASWLSR